MTDWGFSPQVSALVTMYSHEEDIDSAIDVFKQSIGHYQSEQVGTLKRIVSFICFFNFFSFWSSLFDLVELIFLLFFSFTLY